MSFSSGSSGCPGLVLPMQSKLCIIERMNEAVRANNALRVKLLRVSRCCARELWIEEEAGSGSEEGLSTIGNCGHDKVRDYEGDKKNDVE